MIGEALFGGETVRIVCDVDIEKTPHSFHAHAVPDGYDIRPGDVVEVHGIPGVGFGEHVVCQLPATVIPANPFQRAWTQFTAMFELTELYEVGFLPKETP